MQTIPNLLDVAEHTGPNYKPLVDFESWRVAILNHGAKTDFDFSLLNQLDRHDQTDEIFVLLSGRCLLLIGEGVDEVTGVHGVILEPGKVYNVKKGALHGHYLVPGTAVLIVENQDTSAANSTSITMGDEMKKKCVELAEGLLKG